MSRNYKFHNQSKPYFVSFATVNWVDVFIRPAYKDIFVDSMNYCIQHKGLIVYAWVIMSNHVHLIIGTEGDDMQNILRDLKKFTSRNIVKAIKNNPRESRRKWLLWMFERAGQKNGNNETFQFWQQNNQPMELYDARIAHQKITYLHNNPVAGGIVYLPHEYKYSSAIDYADGKGMVDIRYLR